MGDAAVLADLRETVLVRLRPQSPEVSANFRALDFSERQAQAIIELQLQRLTGMEQQKILDELAEIQRLIAEYLEILGDEKSFARDRQRAKGSSERLR